MRYTHEPVLLEESINYLKVQKDRKYIDCTLGGGGHTEQILARGGLVLGLEVDEDAINFCNQKFSDEVKTGRLKLINENFIKISECLTKVGWCPGDISGIIYDLGVSTFQLKEKRAGFSFDDDAVIDMRMDKRLRLSAADLLMAMSERELASVILEYGEEPQARRFAKALKTYIKGKRRQDLIAKDIAEVIKRTSRYRHSKIHPATRTFQALRIAVNSELENLEKSVKQAPAILDSKGRLVVISFHSLEDAIVKSIAKVPALRSITKKPIVPTKREVDRNPSSRSAKMRVYEKK